MRREQHTRQDSLHRSGRWLDGHGLRASLAEEGAARDRARRRVRAAPYDQIRAQVAAQVESGALPAGHRMPTVRGLAEELGVAPGTVARAYRGSSRPG